MKTLTKLFLSTPSGWRATIPKANQANGNRISIHALRVEGDASSNAFTSASVDFYPRPPGGGRRRTYTSCSAAGGFLSTPSGWRATSILRPRKGDIRRFLSTPSGWRATPGAFGSVRESTISIHALRVEGDFAVYIRSAICLYFYPRPPGGGRPDRITKKMLAMIFLSTPSGWRATALKSFQKVSTSRFLSTPSGWRATSRRCPCRVPCHISIHALRVEGDLDKIKGVQLHPRFLSTPSGWRATYAFGKATGTIAEFLSTPSGWRATVLSRTF